MRALASVLLSSAVALSAGLSLSSTLGLAGTQETPSSQNTSPKNTSPLATLDQREVEALAIRLARSGPVVVQIQKSFDAFRASPAARTTDGKATLDQAVRELAFAASLAAADSDPAQPKVVWIATAPREWLGHRVPGSRWGIDNPDNVYRNIPVDGGSKYEITGKVEQPGPKQFSFLVYDSFFGEDGRRDHLDTPIAGLRDKDIKVNPDGTFKITLDSSPSAGRENHLQLNADARVLLVRNTFDDWGHQTPLQVAVTRVDGPASSRPSQPALEQRAAKFLKVGTESVLEWINKGFGASAKANEIAPPFLRGGGWGFAANGNYKLADDEGLVVTITPASAQYIGFDLTDPWLVSREHIKASGSLNNHQAVPNADGSITYVIAARDPGVPNWADTGGLHDGHLLIRWQALTSPTPDTAGALRSVQLVKLSELRAALPAGTPSATAAERARSLEAREAAYAHRYVGTGAGGPLQAALTKP